MLDDDAWIEGVFEVAIRIFGEGAVECSIHNLGGAPKPEGVSRRPPLLHAVLPESLLRRAAATHARLGAAFQADLETWLVELRRMEDPAAEVAFWEGCADAFERFDREADRPPAARREALELLRRLRLGEFASREFIFAEHLSADDVQSLLEAHDAVAAAPPEPVRDY